MRNYLTLAILAGLLFPYPATIQGQTRVITQTVKGTILDKAVKTPIVGATIQLGNAGGSPVSGAISDINGHFRITGVPVGKISVVATYLGYKPAVLNNTTINSGKETDLAIEMEEDIVQAHEVVVTAKVDKEKPLNQLAAVSARTFSVEETQRFAAAINDPARMAASYAGVVMGNDGSNIIVIRGNAPNGLLWRMEGVDIPSPNHFSNVGSSGGGISILSAQLLSNSDFMTGAFPAEYGNALSGVFDLKLRKGNADKYEYTFQAGVLGLDAAMEGPMQMGNQRGSFLVNYRYSTLSLLSGMGVKIGDATTNFQDLSFNAWMPAGKFGSFTLFGMGGLSNQKQTGTADSIIWKSNPDKQYATDFVANTGVLGLTHTKAWDRTFLKTVLAVSSTRNGYDQEQFLRDYSTRKQYDQHFIQLNYTLSSVLNHKFNTRHLLRAGAYFTTMNYDFAQKDWNANAEILEQKVKVSGMSGTLNTFAQWQYQVSDRLTLNTGLHGSLFLLNNRFSAEPRASVKYSFSDRNSVSLGYGLHAQLQPLGTYFAQNGNEQGFQNRNLDFTKAHHLVLSYDQTMAGNWRLKTELYYQALYHIPVSQTGATSFSMVNIVDGFETQALVNNGLGKNYGVELTVEKFLTKGFYCLLSSSLYQSKYQGSDGIWRNTRFNCNYANTLTAGKEWNWNKRAKNRTVGFNLKLTNFGGLRETPVDFAASRQQGETVRDETHAFEVQMPAYFRLDVGFRLKRNFEHLTTTFGIDIQNATNRQNIFGRYYDPNTNQVKTAYQSPLIPVMFYKLEF
jgi:hypothetical protein